MGETRERDDEPGRITLHQRQAASMFGFVQIPPSHAEVPRRGGQRDRVVTESRGPLPNPASTILNVASLYS